METLDRNSKKTRNLALGFAAIAIIALFFGYRYWLFARSHVSTDNAYVSSEVIEITPQVSGTVARIFVKDNQNVKKGDLIAELDAAAYEAAAEQADANLQAAIAQAQGAGVSIELTSATGNAQILQASGGVEQAEGGIVAARADCLKSQAGIEGAQANQNSALANIQTAEAALTNAIYSKARAEEAAKAMKAVVDATKASVRSASAAVDAATAVADKASSDVRRAEALFAQGAISQQAIDQARAGDRAAKAQLENAKQQKQASEATVKQRESELNASAKQVDQAQAAIVQATSQVTAARQLAKASRSAVAAACAQKAAADTAVGVAKAKLLQATGQLNQAKTTPVQVSLSRSAKAQAMAKIAQARAALKSARIQLGYTKIYAPCDGQVSKKSVEVGSLVSPGYPLMALVPVNDLWVVANFKETQLADVREGQPVDIEIDGLPGLELKGHVDSFSAATGSTFALLPADNATGNFTKVVQRIPVRITFDPNQRGIERLKPGMSALTVIKIR